MKPSPNDRTLLSFGSSRSYGALRALAMRYQRPSMIITGTFEVGFDAKGNFRIDALAIQSKEFGKIETP